MFAEKRYAISTFSRFIPSRKWISLIIEIVFLFSPPRFYIIVAIWSILFEPLRGTGTIGFLSFRKLKGFAKGNEPKRVQGRLIK